MCIRDSSWSAEERDIIVFANTILLTSLCDGFTGRQIQHRLYGGVYAYVNACNTNAAFFKRNINLVIQHEGRFYCAEYTAEPVKAGNRILTGLQRIYALSLIHI